MKVVKATLYALKIPFVESFGHSLKTRTFSDSIVARIESDNGVVGFGEGVARPYVTGETVPSCLKYMKEWLWPQLANANFSNFNFNNDPIQILAFFESSLRDQESSNVIAWNAVRSAFELAVLDCWLKTHQFSLSKILPPKRTIVVYSGVITSSSTEKAIQMAKYFKLFGMNQVKVKIGSETDRERLSAIREVLGSSVSLRVDANGAYSLDQAIKVLKEIAQFNIESVEQPLPRENFNDLARLKSESPIPIMVDESIVTERDAEELIEKKACDFFNLRLSKCGGIFRTLQIAKMAYKAGIKLQLGSQVGETAILSAVGRHVAAYLRNLSFVEGSFGTMLLSEDVSAESIKFGHGGKAPLLNGLGFGIHVKEEILTKYADQIIECGES